MNIMLRWLMLSLVCQVSVCAMGAESLDPEQVAGWLKQSILKPNTTYQEAQAYCRAKVRPWAEYSTVAEWETARDQMRADVLKHVIFRGEAAQWRDAKLGVEYLDTMTTGPGYSIQKLRYEALPGLWIPALLYLPDKLDRKVPVAMHVNGHDLNGKAADYKQLRSIHLVKQGMIVLNPEWLGMGQLHLPDFGHYKMNQLDLCGTSGLAPFYLAMSRGLDVLLAHPYADSQQVAVAGLSGGGWQTILISALDERVTLSNPVAGYSSYLTRIDINKDLGDSEQTPVDLGKYADYLHLTAMRAPRPTLLTYNAKDNCCFVAETALPPLLEVAGPLYKLYDRPDALRSHINEDPGDHNFGLDNRLAYYRMVGDHFFANQPFSAEEAEELNKDLQTVEQLHVPLPDSNANFHSLAQNLADSLPPKSAVPQSKAEYAAWKAEFLRILKTEILMWPLDRVTFHAAEDGIQIEDDVKIVREVFQFGEHWTVPVVTLSGVGSRHTDTSSLTVVLADGGRVSAAEDIAKLLDAGERVMAVDPFYFGECGLGKFDFLYGLLLSTVGERPLGIQASQVAAAISGAGEHKVEKFRLEAFGPRSSLIALLAVQDSDVIEELVTHNAFSSLKDIISQNIAVNQAPELFTFGLLNFTDLPQLKAAFENQEIGDRKFRVIELRD
jgi:hypothetical protein